MADVQVYDKVDGNGPLVMQRQTPQTPEHELPDADRSALVPPGSDQFSAVKGRLALRSAGIQVSLWMVERRGISYTSLTFLLFTLSHTLTTTSETFNCIQSK